MLDVTQNYIDTAMNFSRQYTARIVVDNIEYGTDVIANFTYSSTIAEGDKFILGGGYTNTISIDILQIVENILEHTPVQVYVSLSVDQQYVELPLGKFFVTEALVDRNANKTSIKASDAMLFTEQGYTSQLVYPAHATAVFEEIATKLSVDVAPNVVLRNDVITGKLEDITYREALVYLAQLNGGFVRFDRYGRLDICRLNKTNRRLSKGHYFLKGLTKNELVFSLGGIVNTFGKNNDTTKLHSGKSTGIQMELTNPWMTQTILDRLYDEYRKMNYYPFDLKWQGDIALECVDWITLEHANDEWISVPMLNYTLTFNGGLSATSSAKASAQSQGKYVYKGALTKKIEYMESLLSGMNPLYLDSVEPQHAKNGDKWFKPNGSTVELYERMNNEWIKKADTADLNDIVDSLTTDEIIAKKLYGAIANFIEINASKIISGDLDVSRLRIMNGIEEVLTVRDGKIVANLGHDIPVKADLDHLSVSQEEAYANFRQEVLRELEAKAALADLRQWQRDYLDMQEVDKRAIAKASADLIASTERINAIEGHLGSMAVTMSFIDRFVKLTNEGITIGSAETDSYIQIRDNRIAMFSGGAEVMYLSQGVLHIKRGVFVQSVQIGKFVWMSYEENNNMMVLRYVGG